MTDRYEIIHAGNEFADYVRGYYVADTTMTDQLEPLDWTFRNSGNGPELMNDAIVGPFATSADADAYIGRADA